MATHERAGAPEGQQHRQGATAEGAGGQRGERTPARTGQQTVARRGWARRPGLMFPWFTPADLASEAFLASPFALMRRMTDAMDRWMSEVGLGPGISAPGLRARAAAMPTWMPEIDVFRRDNELVVRADLPGLKREDVNVEVEDHVLSISGERRQEEEEREEGYYRAERSYGSFCRTISLPEGVDENQIKASFHDGVLEVTVPLPAEAERRGRRIEIK